MSDEILPFDINEEFGGGEPLRIGKTIVVPRYGSITVEEVRAFEALRKSFDETAQDIEVSIAIAAVVLKTRLGWSDETVRKLPLAELKKVVEFFNGEMREWKDDPLVPVVGDEKKLTGLVSTGDLDTAILTSEDLTVPGLDNARSLSSDKP